MLDLSSKFLRQVGSEEVVSLEGRETSVACALSVVNVLLSSWEDSTKHLQESKGLSIQYTVENVLIYLQMYPNLKLFCRLRTRAHRLEAPRVRASGSQQGSGARTAQTTPLIVCCVHVIVVHV